MNPLGLTDQDMVDVLEEVWDSIASLGDDLREDEWKRHTELPGWSVQDNLVHLSAIESMSLGRPWRDHEAADLSHVKNDVGKSNEHAVDSRRSWPGQRALIEFRSITRERIAQLRALDDAGFAAESWTPMGPGTVRDLIPFRIFDSWVHEQDMRRAVHRPGDLISRAAEVTLDMIDGVMPYVVGKKVAPPDGSTIVFSVTGPMPRELAIAVIGGRAKRIDEIPPGPTLRLTMDSVTYERLACGRVAPSLAIDAGEVRVTGDAALGRKLVAEMNYMF